MPCLENGTVTHFWGALLVKACFMVSFKKICPWEHFSGKRPQNVWSTGMIPI